MTDNVNKPKHYQGRFGIEVIEVIKNFLTKEEFRGYLKGNIIKYVLRADQKNGLEDIQKGQKYSHWLSEETDHDNRLEPVTFSTGDKVILRGEVVDVKEGDYLFKVAGGSTFLVKKSQFEKAAGRY